MKKIFSFFILLILANLAAVAQYDPLFSNYMFATQVSNPSVVGLTNNVNALFMTRTMFTGFGEGTPQTSVFGVNMPLSLFGKKGGFGVLITSDAIGFQDEVGVDFSYSYHHENKNRKLSFGATVGFNDYNIDGEWEVPQSGDGLVGDFSRWSDQDPILPDAHSYFSMDVAFGVRYETSRYYLSFAANHLNEAGIKDAAKNEGIEYSYYARHYYLMGEYNIELPDPLFEIRPSFMYRTNLSAHILDLNGTMYYKDKYRAGLGLRVSPFNIAAITFIGGVELANGLMLNYAMDVNTTAMFLYAPTSHEVMVTYSFSLETKRNQKYKSIRYL